MRVVGNVELMGGDGEVKKEKGRAKGGAKGKMKDRGEDDQERRRC